jgi:hypothetical protein
MRAEMNGAASVHLRDLRTSAVRSRSGPQPGAPHAVPSHVRRFHVAVVSRAAL